MLPHLATAILTVASLVPLAMSQQPELHVLELSGTAYERGVQHGEALRDPIAEMLTHWREDVRRATGLDSEQFVARFLAATHFDTAARRHTPDLLDEVRGIAAGSAQQFETMLCYQLIDELWALGHTVAADKCSTIGVDRAGTAPSFVAQNLDLPRWMHAHPTLLRIRDDSRHGANGVLESLVVTIPGLIAANGLNNHRIAVGVNTILPLRPSATGLPVAFVVRGLLACTSHADALHWLGEVPHASGQAYTVGGPDQAPCFEASAAGVVRWQPVGCETWRWHTNNAHASNDWAPRWTATAAARGLRPDQQPPCARFAAIADALPAGRRPAPDQVVTALRESTAAPVCNNMTYCCTIMLLGEQPELRVVFGRPDRGEFTTFGFGDSAAIRPTTTSR